MVTEDNWFLDREERGNPASRIDTRHDSGTAWSHGNTVRPIPHGAPYFTELLSRVRELGSGDLLMFTDWRGDPGERLDGPGTEVADVFAEAARRGVVVKGLLWRSHWDKLFFSAEENRHLGDAIEEAGGECLRDMRVPLGGSHHQKLLVVRRKDLDEGFASKLRRFLRATARGHQRLRANPETVASGVRRSWRSRRRSSALRRRSSSLTASAPAAR